MDIKAFIYHKRAEKYSDCQDCFGIDTQNNRIAVSDGMSQSIFPQWWAKILVDAFLETGKIPYDNTLPYQIQWQNRVRNEIERQETDGKNPWLLKDMFAERIGAGATICGFEWDYNGWTCQCLGDSCLIKINYDYSIEIITSQQGQFDNHPDYLDSFMAGRGTPVSKNGDFNLKAILLVTDPFAELFQIHQNENEFIKSRYCELCKIYSQESYVQLIEKWRDDYNMHNDDSTLVLLTNFNKLRIEQIISISLEDLCLDELESIKIEGHESKNRNNDSDEKKAAESQFKNSTEKLLKYYPADRNRSKGKIYDWIKEFVDSIVETFSKK